MDKVKFWKRDDFSSDLGKGADQPPSFDLGTGRFDPSAPDPMHQDATPDGFPQQFAQQSYPQSTPFPGSLQPRQQQQVEQYQEPGVSQRDVELILAKLDAIKSDLDALHQRVRKIEQATEQPPQQKRYW